MESSELPQTPHTCTLPRCWVMTGATKRQRRAQWFREVGWGGADFGNKSQNQTFEGCGGGLNHWPWNRQNETKNLLGTPPRMVFHFFVGQLSCFSASSGTVYKVIHAFDLFVLQFEAHSHLVFHQFSTFLPFPASNPQVQIQQFSFFFFEILECLKRAVSR